MDFETLCHDDAQPETNGDPDYTRIHYLIRTGDCERITAYLHNAKIDINAKDPSSGATPLHIAASCGYTDVASLLIREGASVNAQDNNGATPLFSACAKFATSEMVELLLEQNADPNIRTHSGKSPLYLCIEKESLALVAIFISWYELERIHLDVNKSDNHGVSMLHLAAKLGLYSTIQDLLHVDADVNSIDNRGNSVFHMIADATQNARKCLKFLAQKGASRINHQNEDGNTPLHLAVLAENEGAIKCLILHGADVMIRNNIGQTCLHLAVIREGLSKARILNILYANKQGLNVPDRDGNTPFLSAVENKAHDVAQEMMNRGVDKFAQNKHGLTGFDIAFEAADRRMMWLLLRKEAASQCRQLRYDPGSGCVDMTNKEGFTLLHYACSFKDLELITALINKGASLTKPSPSNETPWVIFLRSWWRVNNWNSDSLFKIFQLFGSKGVSLDVTLADQSTTLHTYEKYISSKTPMPVQQLFNLLCNGCRVNEEDSLGVIPFENMVSPARRREQKSVWHEARLRMLLSAGSQIGLRLRRKSSDIDLVSAILPSSCSHVESVLQLRDLVNFTMTMTDGRQFLRGAEFDWMTQGYSDLQKCLDTLASPLSLQQLCAQVVRMRCFPNAFVAAPKLPLPLSLVETVRGNYHGYEEQFQIYLKDVR